MRATNHACCLNHLAGHAKLVQQIIKVPAKAVDIFGKTSERDRVVTVFFEDTTPAPRPIAIINHGRFVKPEERAAFGRSTLWVYAENDPWMGPTFPREWFQAYKENGGTGDFVQYPPHGQDGHNLFVEGINVWRPQALQWLKTNGYPELTASKMKS